MAKSQFAFAITFTNLESSWVEKARKGEVVVLRADETNKLRAVVKLNSYVDAYLLVGRFIDSKVLLAMDQTRLAASDYQQLGFQQLDLQISFAVLFGIILLLISDCVLVDWLESGNGNCWAAWLGYPCC